jgi:proteic killer suppression protein
MIKGFKDEAARAVFDGENPKGFPSDILKVAGDRAGQHSIRINDQFRVCFKWTPEGPTEVEITDYH